MKYVIVPNDLDAAISRKLDKAFLECPDAAKDRAFLRNQLLDYFDVHGDLPDFTLGKRGEDRK